MTNINIQSAVSALSQLSALANGLRGAQIVLDALANAEQVGKELDVALATKRAAIDQAANELAAHAAQRTQVVAESEALTAKAQADADQIVSDAKAQASAASDGADVVVAHATAAVAAAAAQHKSLCFACDTKAADLAELEAKLAAADAARRAALA